ncbi:uncharacterized protein KY384_000371 [Bacidia gigantensis]|uniref:uncharacterized protein n=1 Tax=Bacidia gigantensis TaxID=2732470 RepID=UPI001D04BA86|nr:uncharacterized protein KY384_000371 [Bacidia gigantensis]KAG8526378.1 hypothetical protein KY384_000371 [Bacidia gigantensis]
MQSSEENAILRSYWIQEKDTVAKYLVAIKGMLEDTDKLESRYGLKLKHEGTSALALTSGNPSTSFATMENSIKSKAQRRQRNSSILRQARWAIFDKKKFDRLIADLSFFVNELDRLSRHLRLLAFQEQPEFRSYTGDFTSLDVDRGRFDVTACIEDGEERPVEQILRDVLSGTFEEFKQSFIASNRQEIRGWMSDTFEDKFTTAISSLLTQSRHVHNDFDDAYANSAGDDDIHRTGTDGETTVRGALVKLQDQSSDLSIDCSKDLSSRPYVTITSRKHTIIGDFVLRSVRYPGRNVIRLLFVPSAFVSRGVELQYSLQYDNRGYPLLKDMGLWTYGLVDDDDPIYDVIEANDVNGVRMALSTGAVSLSDRDRTSVPMLRALLKRQGVEYVQTGWSAALREIMDTFVIAQDEADAMLITLDWLGVLQGVGFNLHFQDENGVNNFQLLLLTVQQSVFTEPLEGQELSNLLESRLSRLLLVLLAGADPSEIDDGGCHMLHHLLLLSPPFLGSLRESNIRPLKDLVDAFAVKYFAVVDFVSEGIILLCLFGCDLNSEDYSGYRPCDWANLIEFQPMWDACLWSCGLGSMNSSTTSNDAVSSAMNYSYMNDGGSNLKRRRAFLLDQEGIDSSSCVLDGKQDEEQLDLTQACSVYKHRDCPQSCRSKIVKSFPYLARHLLWDLFCGNSDRGKAIRPRSWPPRDQEKIEKFSLENFTLVQRIRQRMRNRSAAKG